MRTRAILAIAISLGLGLLAPGGPARAQDPGGGPPPEPRDPNAMEMEMGQGMGAGMGTEMRHQRMERLEQLDLSKEQRDKIADLRDKQQRAAIRTRADLETARLDLRRLTRAEKADRAAINKQVDRMAQLRAELEKARIGLMLDIRGLLTPEQQERMRAPRSS